MVLSNGRLFQRSGLLTLAFILTISSVSAAMPFVFAKVANATDGNQALVANVDELKSALADSDKTYIELTNDITTSEKLVLGRSNVVIQGNDKTIALNDNIAGWQGNYVLQVYNASNVSINSLRLTGGDAGLLVNGSKVTLTGHTHVGGNTFGGIEVSNGANPTYAAALTSTYHLYNDTEVNGEPTVWTDGANATFTDQSNETVLATHIKPNQKQYYLKAANTGTVATNSTKGTTYESLQSAFDAASTNDVVVLNKDVEIQPGARAAVLSTNITLDGQGRTIKTLGVSGSSGEQKNSALIVSSANASGATIKNIIVEGTALTNGVRSSNGLNIYEANITISNIVAVNNSVGVIVNRSVVAASGITTKGSSWGYGINVDQLGAKLSISGTNSSNEPVAIYVDNRSVGAVVDVNSKYTKTSLQGTADYYNLDLSGPNGYFQLQPPALVSGLFATRLVVLGESGTKNLDKQIYFDSAVAANLCANDNSLNFNLDASCDTSGLSDGVHKLVGVIYDIAGNRTEITSTTFIVDRTPPTDMVTGATQSSKNTLSFSGYVNDTNFNRYYCYLTTNSTINLNGHTYTPGQEVSGTRGANCQSTRAPSYPMNGNPSSLTNQGSGSESNLVKLGDFDITSLPSGDYTVNLVTQDLAGNSTANSPATFVATIDHTAPTVTVLDPIGDVATGSVQPSVTAIDTNSPLTYSWSADSTNPAILSFDHAIAGPTFTPTVAGTYNFTLVTTDTLGNSTTKPFSFSYAPIVAETAAANIGTPAPAANLVAANTQPTTDNLGTTGVLGAQTKADTTATDTAATPEVKGASTQADQASGWALAWYWWVLIVAAAISFVWWLIARRRNLSEA